MGSGIVELRVLFFGFLNALWHFWILCNNVRQIDRALVLWNFLCFIFCLCCVPDISFLSLFWSVHRDQIVCSLLRGFSKPRTAATQSLDSILCSMLYILLYFPFVYTCSAPFRPTWAACPAFCFLRLLPLHVCPRVGRRFRFRFPLLGPLPVYARPIPPP